MDINNLPDEKSFRFIAVLNKKIEIGKLMNALGHMTAGLAGKSGKAEEMYFLEYKDKNNGIHPNISHFPFVVLIADNSNQIRTVRNEAVVRNVVFTDFTSTMTIGTSQQQRDATAATPGSELEYYGICMFGPTDVLREFTGKFSLFR